MRLEVLKKKTLFPSVTSSPIILIIVVSFQFQFVNSFLSLFYIAFYLQDQERLKEVGLVLSYERQHR